MCDTLVLHGEGATWFAKNSDREPLEPQRLVRLPAVHGDPDATVQTTYLRIPQTASRHAVILSQPTWMWGAEMGVNARGVAIGNEAVFTRLVARQGEALLGMDLLRLGLERGDDARHALDIITGHLARYGQGGPAGYRDKKFRYDNSFLIADPRECWVLETAGRFWAAKRVARYAISNQLTLGADFDLSSPDLPGEARRAGLWNGRGDFHFARTFDTWLLPWVGGARTRRGLSERALAQCAAGGDWASLAAALRQHGDRGDDLRGHNNRQVCLHAGGFWRPSQTTASLIARLSADTVELAATGTSAPCLGLFQPLSFDEASGGAVLSDPAAPAAETLWAAFEPVHWRALADAPFRQALRASRDALEPGLLARSGEWDALAGRARQWHGEWQGRAAEKPAPRPRRW